MTKVAYLNAVFRACLFTNFLMAIYGSNVYGICLVNLLLIVSAILRYHYLSLETKGIPLFFNKLSAAFHIFLGATFVSYHFDTYICSAFLLLVLLVAIPLSIYRTMEKLRAKRQNA